MIHFNTCMSRQQWDLVNALRQEVPTLVYAYWTCKVVNVVMLLMWLMLVTSPQIKAETHSGLAGSPETCHYLPCQQVKAVEIILSIIIYT